MTKNDMYALLAEIELATDQNVLKALESCLLPTDNQHKEGHPVIELWLLASWRVCRPARVYSAHREACVRAIDAWREP